MNYTSRVSLLRAIVALLLQVSTVAAVRLNPAAPVVSGPQGIYPYICKGVGVRTSLAPSSGDPSWGLLAHSRRNNSRPDTLHIIAFMVEFNGGKPDTVEATTGTGLFSFWQPGTGSAADYTEYQYYQNGTYRYDRLDHYQPYFERKLAFARDYYRRVSNGRLELRFEVYPRELGRAYHVPKPMAYYSPGGKLRKETWDEYYFRKTKGLMEFVADAVRAARDQQGAQGSPFERVRLNAQGDPVDSNGNPVGFMILHAGASYLTDGGKDGTYGTDSPSDMIDAFISEDFFRYFRDVVAFDSGGGTVGVRVRGADGDFVIDELMMAPQTSNQDGLNWGIHGILVNQIARQLGIPDLFSTSSGISGIGAFCIMDFAGYSAGQGFLPPRPSAWVRAFMGWDDPVVAPMGVAGEYRVRSLAARGRAPSDTTILLVPINDHEYYLIENRQRNPAGLDSVLKTDTTGGTPHLASYPYNVNLSAAITTDSTGEIRDVYCDDVGIPASGVLIWHVDEEVIRRRLSANLVNADSLYRGIALVEADGVNDLGMMFTDMFYQAVFDWGGPEDVFPHTRTGTGPRTVDSLGPYTRPSTRSNDGGQTYLTIRVRRENPTAPPRETYAIRDYFVKNYTDSLFRIGLNWSFLSPGWPRRIAPDSVFEPLVCDVAPTVPGQEILVLSRTGKLYVLPARPDTLLRRYNPQTALVPVVSLRGDTLRDSTGTHVSDTVFYAATVDSPAGMPALANGTVLIPSMRIGVMVLKGINGTGIQLWDTLALSHAPSTNVCVYGDSGRQWAIGCADGWVQFGGGTTLGPAVKLPSDSPVTAVAALADSAHEVVCVQRDGTVSVCARLSPLPMRTVKLTDGIAPFLLATGDVDNNDGERPEIVVTDSRHGVWLLNDDLIPASGWTLSPNDWASTWATTEHGTPRHRVELPVNTGPVALADLNRDGCLDIVIGGTNGLYALNYKGVLVKGWPFYLDNRSWLQRGSVTSSPVVACDNRGEPLALFSSPTGDFVTFGIARITAVSPTKTKVYYRRPDGTQDSIWGLEPSLVDSLLRYNDSLIAPYILPGGYVDAVTAAAQRPLRAIANLPNTGAEALYDWPLTVGATIGTAPVVCDVDHDDTTDLVAVSAAGWVWRWELPPAILRHDAGQWLMVGAEPGRSFAYSGPAAVNAGGADTLGFYSFPNPAVGTETVVFRYAFTKRAANVRIDIYTYTGHLVYTWKEPSDRARLNYPDWNEHQVSLRGLGPGVYRCRLGATVGGKEVSRFWKMAVVK